MSRRIEKIDKEIQRIFGQLLQTEADLPADILVTISDVETHSDLRSVIIWISVLPANAADQILQSLNEQIYYLQGSLNKKLGIHPLPRIKLRIDHGFQHSDNISHTLAKLDR